MVFVVDLRIPFSIAIKDRRLLRDRWDGTEAQNYLDGLSLPQKVALKTLYGLPIESGEELSVWSAQQGNAQYDDLGYCTKVDMPRGYVPKKYNEAWMIVGRRGGKTDRFASTIVAYEACFGGHEQYITRGQKAYCFQIAQDLRNAAMSLHFIFATIEGSPAGRELLDGPPIRDEIRLKNNLIIKCIPCTLKASRGFANPVAVLDEVGVWYQESDSANPDYEIYRGVRPGQLQFPNRLIVGISSPYNKQGLLFTNYEAGTEGVNAPQYLKRQFRNMVIIHSPTASMQNPFVSRGSLEEERDRDPKAFERECLAIFQDSISGFLSSSLLREATMIGVFEREPQPQLFTYVAAIDPAFRHDAFAFSIFHLDEDGFVIQDVVRRYKADTRGPLNPDAVLKDIAPLLSAYQIVTIYSDQYHLESLQQLALRLGFIIEGVPFKASNKAMIYGSLQQLLNQRRIKLLDNSELLKELRQLEKKLTSGGVVQISAPNGQYDDLATVTALCANKCLWLTPKPQDEPIREETVHQKILKQIEGKRIQNVYKDWD